MAQDDALAGHQPDSVAMKIASAVESLIRREQALNLFNREPDAVAMFCAAALTGLVGIPLVTARHA